MAVEEAILAHMSSGDLKPGDRLEKPRRLARQMNVGEGTVRHALQSLAARGYVERRPRVGTIVAKLPGEEDDVQTEQNLHTIYSLIVPDIRNPQFACLARGVQDAAARQQIDVVTCNTDDDPQVYENLIHRCIENRIDGLIMVPPFDRMLSLRTLADLQDAKIPVVTCWRSIDAAGWPLVRGDTFDGGRTAVRHLVERGYQTIGMVSGTALPTHPETGSSAEGTIYDQSRQIFTDIHNGYARGLQDAGRPLDDQLILDFQYDRDTTSAGHLDQHPAVSQIESWLKVHPAIDAVMCSHDFIAALLLHALARLGKKTPDDIGVVGAGNIPIYHSALQGTLTTLDGHFTEIGESACRLLAEMRGGKTFPPGYTHVIPSRLVVGSSTQQR
ncbi:MAG: GntR family transcriptional regulator [Phycisphaeraceae bacterium]|nr:GntR family transcriptional regulator [Phycisphaeraceae bacterium]